MKNRFGIKELARKHINDTRKCIAFGLFGDKKFFAFNGIDNLNSYGDIKLLNDIKHILGSNAEWKGDKYAFSVFNPSNPPKDIKTLERAFYSNIKAFPNNFTYCFKAFNMTHIDFTLGSYPKIDNRFFACAEKKLYNLDTKPKHIYVTGRPCFHCLPVVENVYFLENKKIYHLKRWKDLKNENDIFQLSIK